MSRIKTICLWLNLNSHLNFNNLISTLYKLLYNTNLPISKCIISKFGNINAKEMKQIEKIILDKDEKIQIETVILNQYDDYSRNEIITKIKEDYFIILNEFYESIANIQNISWDKDIYFVKCKFENFEFFEPFIIKKGSKTEIKDGKWLYTGDEFLSYCFEDNIYFLKKIDENYKQYFYTIKNEDEIYTQFFYAESLLFSNKKEENEKSLYIFEKLLKLNIDNDYKYIIHYYIQKYFKRGIEKLDYLLEHFQNMEDRLELFYEMLFYLCENKNINGINNFYTIVQKHLKVFKPFTLFYIDVDVYNYKFEDISSTYLYIIEKYQEAADLTRNILNRDIPMKDVFRIKSNLLFYEKKISKTEIKIIKDNKPVICFYIGYINIIEGNKLSQNIFGSELALINLVKRMKENYNVFVTCFNIPESYLIDGVKYISLNNLRNFEKIYDKKIDILVISRYINYFLEVPHNARFTILWLHDMCLQAAFQGRYLTNAGRYLFKNMYKKIDKIVCLSDWHRDNIQTLYGIDDKKINIIGNGINLENFNFTSITKTRGKFIWISDFTRGGKELVENFWRIKEILPEAELHIFRDINDKVAERVIEEKYSYIKLRGKVNNTEILKELLTSEYWLYTTNFCETYCISALEAQLSGCICICSNLGALTTTVGDRGVLLRNEIFSEGYWKEVVENIKFFESDINRKINIISKGMNWAKSQTWDNVWNDWNQMIRNLLM